MYCNFRAKKDKEARDCSVGIVMQPFFLFMVQLARISSLFHGCRQEVLAKFFLMGIEIGEVFENINLKKKLRKVFGIKLYKNILLL